MTKTIRRVVAALLAGAGLAAAGGCSVFGIRTTEEPPFEVIAADDEADVEIRRYGEVIVATTEVEGSFEEGGNAGFRRLAGYIFGANRADEGISMTAPVVMEADREEEAPSASIAMTAPVLMEGAPDPDPDGDGDGGGRWVMSFVMPAEYASVESLPVPLDESVRLTTLPGRTVAALRYSGSWDAENHDEHRALLARWLETSGYRAVSPFRVAGYDPPWTIPFLRRNEVLVDVEPATW